MISCHYGSHAFAQRQRCAISEAPSGAALIGHSDADDALISEAGQRISPVLILDA